MHGKAAIDVLGARMGKSGGALLQQLLVLACGDILRAAPVTACLFYAVMAAWIAAAVRLGGLFATASAEHAAARAKAE